MSENGELPFEIKVRLAGRSCTFVALRGEQTIAAERYAPGNSSQRRKVANRWARDDRLRNGQLLKANDIETELERAEIRAMEAQAGEADEDDNGIEDLSRASFVDEEVIVELAWNRETADADFIIYDRNAEDITRETMIETAAGTLCVPRTVKGIGTPGYPIEGAVFLPDNADREGENGPYLRREIERFIHRYVELPADSVALAVEYVFLTWIYDAFSELPYLAFRTSDAGRGKSRALETIGSLCYRPLFVGGGSSAAATLRMLDVFRGTLIADEFDQSKDTDLAADICRILNQGFQSCRPLVKCDGDSNQPRAFRCYGPKLFALRTRLGDDATESRTISIQMRQRTRTDVPLNLPREAFDREALAIRNMLLAWRFANHGKMRIRPELADPTLEDRANQIGLPLLAVARTEETRARIVEALRAGQSSAAHDRADSFAGEVFETVRAIAQPGECVRPREVADRMNRDRAAAAGIDVDRLGRQMVTPHRAAKALRVELEFPAGARDRDSSRYLVDADRVRELVSRFGLAPSRATTPTAHLHSSPMSTSEKPYSEVLRGDYVDGVDGAVAQGEGAIGDVEDLEFPPPEDAE